MSATFTAAVIDRFGDAEHLRLRELPLPRLGRGEILVKVEAASLNPIDVRRRTGYGRGLLSLRGATSMPLVLGNDFAGTVCAVGAAVRGWREGDAVFGAKPPSSHGSHASHVAVDARHVQRMPAGMNWVPAAALPYNFQTVWRALDDAGITQANVQGRRVLVHGASGGLGLIGLRLLNAMGAEVTAMAGANAHQQCLQAGASVVLDRHTTPLHTLPAQFDATLNFAHWDDEPALLSLLTAKAIGHATTVHPLLSLVDQFGLAAGLTSAWHQRRRQRPNMPAGARYAWTVFQPSSQALQRLVEFGPLLRLPGALVSYSLDQVALAHRHLDHRSPGRVVLLPQLC